MARALVFLVMGTVHTVFAPLHAPDQLRKRQPFAGVARSRSAVYDGTAAEQCVPHEIPLRALSTTPRPRWETSSRYVAGAKSAETRAPSCTVTLHAALPLQAPVQRTSFVPAVGVAVRFSWVPSFQVVEQLRLHRRPGTSDVTVPGPAIASENVIWSSSCTSQRESWTSGHEPEWP